MRNEHAGAEPRYTIHGPAWDAARARVASLPSEHTRREHGALLDYVELGWTHLRPLQLHAEAQMARRDKLAPSDDMLCVADYVDASITDEFREFAIACRDAVGTNPRILTGCDLADEAEAVLRALRVLGMAAGMPEFPPALRGFALDALEGFGCWLPGLRPMLAPLERITCLHVAVAGLRVVG